MSNTALDHIARFESLVRDRDFEPAMSTLLAMLGAIRAPDANLDPASASRIVAATIRLIADRDFSFSAAGLEVFCAYKPALAELFAYSGFVQSEFVKYCLGTPDGAGEMSFDSRQLLKIFALTSLDSIDPTLLDALPTLPPDVAVALLLAWLSEPACLLPEAEANRQRLLGMRDLLAGSELSDRLACLQAWPWMYCSYSEAPAKHAFKVWLNRSLRRWLHGRGADRIPQPVSRQPLPTRPTLLVVLEHFRSEHAMFRCHAGPLQSLATRFRLLALVPEQEIDNAGRALFEAVVPVEPMVLTPEGLIDQVRALAPDAILYPSIGMAHWSIWLANLRLAPVQMMLGGHPATSASPDIDYFLVPEGCHLDPVCFTERLVMFSSPQSFHVPHPQFSAPSMHEASDNAPLRIAVPANALKLSPCFLDACREITRRSERQLRFRFFPHRHGIETAILTRQIRCWLADAEVEPRLDYGTYLSRLAECQIALGTYPFGASSSAYDSMQLGIPWLCWDGPELHSGAERPFLEQSGQPSWLCVEDAEAYVAAALRLIENDEERRAITCVLREQAQQRQAPQSSADSDADIASTVDWLLANHTSLLADPRRVWSRAARASASADALQELTRTCPDS